MTDFHVVNDEGRWHVVMGLAGFRRRLTTRGYRTRERAQQRANDEAHEFNRRQKQIDDELARIESLINEQRHYD